MDDWMPVFLIVDGATSHVAAHPDHKGETLREPESEPVLSRIGTARKAGDGGYVVDLVAIPLSGRLLLRPPTADDAPALRVPRGK